MPRLNSAILLLAAFLLAACGVPTETGSSDEAPTAAAKPEGPEVDVKPSGELEVAGKPMAPIRVDYRIVGEPVVGQPVAIELEVGSTLGVQPVTVSYRISDASALQLAEAQPPRVTVTAPGENRPASQQVTVVPLREGRLYLNVAASIDTGEGALSTVTAIPIQVGSAPRALEENGEITTDADGERLRVMPAKED
jgi:hypothetical protein